MSIRPFHLAFPVTDLQQTQLFYETVIGCSIGRRSERWIDFDFFGHYPNLFRNFFQAFKRWITDAET